MRPVSKILVSCTLDESKFAVLTVYNCLELYEEVSNGDHISICNLTLNRSQADNML